MPRPKKTVTVRNASGQTSTPDVKVVANERAQIEALNIAVADLQNRVRMMEARQNPYAALESLFGRPTPGLPAFGQPHPMYARMGAMPVPNQMYQPVPQCMHLEPKLRNPTTINKIMSTDLRMFGFTEAQIEKLHKQGIFVLGKMIQAVIGSGEVTLSRALCDDTELLRKANSIIEWVNQFVTVDASVMNPAIDNANNVLAFTSKEGEKDHGDHV